MSRMVEAFCLLVFAIASLGNSLAHADSIPIAKFDVLRHLAQSHQIAVISVNDEGIVDVHLFITIIDRSGKSNEVRLVLPFVDEPLEFKATELNLSEFQKKHTEPLDLRIEQIEIKRKQVRELVNFYWNASLVMGAPCIAMFLPPIEHPIRPGQLVKALAPGVATPFAVIVTEHTRTEIYKIERAADIDLLLQKAKFPKEAIARTKRHLGKFLYLVTIQTVPITPSSAQPPTERPSEREEDVLGVDFHVRLKATRQSRVWTFTYPLGTGETWLNPIELTQVYATASNSCRFLLSYPILEGVPIGPRMLFAKGQSFFFGRDESGQIARLSYWHVNPADNVVIKIDPTHPERRMNIATAVQVAEFSWLIFTFAFVLTWCIAAPIFARAFTPKKQPQPLLASLLEIIGVGVLWVLCNSLFLWNMQTYWELRSRFYDAYDFFERHTTETMLLIVAIVVALTAIALLPSVQARLKVSYLKLLLSAPLSIIIGILIVLALLMLLPMLDASFAMVGSLSIVFHRSFFVIGLLLGAFVVLKWMRIRNAEVNYWHCLGFSGALGCIFGLVTVLLRWSLLGLLSV